jgi:hypothetical protein
MITAKFRKPTGSVENLTVTGVSPGAVTVAVQVSWNGDRTWTKKRQPLNGHASTPASPHTRKIERKT